MNELKQYKPISLVFYINGNGDRDALPLDDSKREAFKKAVENNKMVELEGIVINTFDIKEIRSADKTSDIEKYFYSLPWEKRAFLNLRAKAMSENKKMNAVDYFSGWVNQEKALERMQGMIAYFDEENL